jgi:hypothetical protein
MPTSVAGPGGNHADKRRDQAELPGLRLASLVLGW